MTLNEIAKALNISKTTVSFCLNGRAKEFGLRQELEDAVKAYAEEHGYLPNRAARRLRAAGKTPPVGIVFSSENGIRKFASTFLEAFRYLHAMGREYIFMGTEMTVLGDTMQTLRSMDVKDVLLIGRSSEPDDRAPSTPEQIKLRKQWDKIDVLLKNGMRLYLANYAFPMPEKHLSGNVVRVGLDREKLQLDFIRKAQAAGLGPVAVTRWTTTEKRLVPAVLDEDLIIPCRWQEQCEGGKRVARYVLELRKKRPLRTVFISNVVSAISLIRVLTDAGLRVPEDIAVAAFGDDPLAEAARPSVTTVGGPEDDRTLDILKSICGELPPFPAETVVPYSYRERESLRF